MRPTGMEAELRTDRESISRSRQIAGRVTRYHTWPMIRKPTVIEHAGRVTTIYVELWGLPRAEVMLYCLRHDDGEQTAGDLPFNAKGVATGYREAANVAEEVGRRALGVSLPQINGDEYRRFKICDLLEMWECGVVECNMGNRYAGPVVLDTLRAALVLSESENERSAIRNWTEGRHRLD